jgi:hypothetical protein
MAGYLSSGAGFPRVSGTLSKAVDSGDQTAFTCSRDRLGYVFVSVFHMLYNVFCPKNHSRMSMYFKSSTCSSGDAFLRKCCCMVVMCVNIHKKALGLQGIQTILRRQKGKPGK